MDNDILNDRLWELMGLSKSANVTRFAEKLGMNRQTVDRYLNGHRKPDIPSLIQICKIMNVSADWLLGISDIRSISAETHSAVQYTGLPEKTIERIRLDFDEARKTALADLVEDETFFRLLGDYAVFNSVLARLVSYEQVEDMNNFTADDEHIGIPLYTFMCLMGCQVSNDMVEICEQKKREKRYELYTNIPDQEPPTGGDEE